MVAEEEAEEEEGAAAAEEEEMSSSWRLTPRLTPRRLAAADSRLLPPHSGRRGLCSGFLHRACPLEAKEIEH